MLDKKIAIVYDWLDKWGGVERVLLTFYEMFPEATFFTSYFDPKKAGWAKDLKIKTSFIQYLPKIIRENRIASFPFYPYAFESFNFNDYELVISVTSSFAKSIITQPKTKHICYLLTPTRFLWSHQKDYFKENIFNKNYLEYLKQWDLAAAQRPDKIFSISETAKNRCKKYYHRDSEVIYPPFDTEYWRSLSSRPKWRDLIKKIPRLASLARNDRGVRKKYFLIVSRLEPYKKIDLAINVFNKLNDNLVIVGEGSEENNLRRISGGNITFFKKITDEELGYLYSNAQALIMPQEEDFGYISLEAQFFGCPAISYKKGGALETVIEGKTGIFFDKQSENSLRKAVERFAKIKYNLRTNTRKHGEENVKRFSKETFINNFRNVISSEVDLPTDRQGNLKKIPRRFAPRDDGGCVMKAIIFAGGTGTRLWPLSRKKSPKQFEKLIGNKSTLQLAVERLLPDFQYEDIYISSNSLYKESIKEQLPQIPEKNLILEPEKKDVAPAIALSVGIIAKTDPNEPIAILWSDHLVKEVHVFRKILKVAAEEIKKNPNKIIFITHKPRFASINLGYIHFGKKIREVNGISFHEFKNIKYRPDEKTAKTFFNSGEYAWNLGYFVTTPQFILKAFRKLAPEIYANTEKILACYGKKIFPDILKTKYRQVKNISFDNAILEKLAKEEAMVIVEDIGWSDVGSWEALKEALESHSYENVIRGKVYLEHVRDSLIYNYQDDKLIVGVDLDENIIVNTNDVILIAKKNSMPKVKNLVENFTGTKHEKHI